ncbi:MAG: hypothetical protein KAH23_04745 [Kiritimatiellae bacterium]|nr:hypothetical protein [Kiritimatiellia bacterium]
MKYSFICFLCLITLTLGLITGCELDGGDHNLGDGHDFGDNDYSLCVALGDSITEGHGLDSSETYPSQLTVIIAKTVVNEGNGGEHSNEGASRVNNVLNRHKPGFLLILYGANDIIYSRSNSSIIASLRSIIDAAKNNKTIPVIATLTPANEGHSFMSGAITELNTLIRQLAGETGTTLVDLESAFGDGTGLLDDDGLHPNVNGATMIALSFAGVF